MKLKQVTITGADNSIDYNDLFKITREYPFVEWGILLSKNSEGYSRFPTWDWIEGLLTEKPPGVHLSGHLCGAWVRDIVGGGLEFITAKRALSYGFGRYQLNFHANPHGLSNPEAFITALFHLTGVYHQQIIFQWDGVNELLYRKARSLYGQSSGIDAAVLYDISGGAGTLPEEWPEPIGGYCGYAGGLSPDNLQEQLKKLEPIVKEYPIWIDAETHLRSKNDKQFDLVKVIRFLEVAKTWVMK